MSNDQIGSITENSGSRHGKFVWDTSSIEVTPGTGKILMSTDDLFRPRDENDLFLEMMTEEDGDVE